ncbi:sulfate respiration complex hexadecaheme cytochrome HmcA [Thermodesulfobacteriota bacterium]
MKKLRSRIVLAVILLTVTTVLIYSSGASDLKSSAGPLGETRADVTTLDILKDFGALERERVVFLHDLHTDTLEKKNKDCTACHISANDRLSPKFKRLKDTGRQEVMDIYHTECMACHKEMSAVGEKTGPVEVCGECHLEKPKVTSSRQPIGFDKSLHFRHSKANDDRCELCHHEYDEKTKKLLYVKEKEGSCRYCHKELTEENRISMRLASHLSCIDCHRKRLANAKVEALPDSKIAGPVKCSGCHDPKKQQEIEKIKNIPRIKRNQPDIVLIQSGIQKTKKQEITLKMNPVPFDHKAHEGHNDTCRTCHHESLDSCAKRCHTLTGSKEGKYVKLERAMHQMGVNKSCIGCHEIKQQEKRCAGCHTFMEKSRKQEEPFCHTCHMKPLQETVQTNSKPEAVATMLLQSRRAITDTYNDEDIPEKVIIGELFDLYESVEFPHRKIVHTLVNNIKDNKLANYFHNKEGSICRACHHNSPVTKKPPRCVSCHGKPFDEKNISRPGLKAAYHQQCIGCHKEMGIEKPNSAGCIDCHKEVGIPRL